jgi:hypothetical protein
LFVLFWQAYAELVRTLKENPEYLAHAVTCKDFNPPQVDSMMQMVRHQMDLQGRRVLRVSQLLSCVSFEQLQVTWSLHSDFYRPHANKELMYFTRRVTELQFAEYAQKPGNFLRLNSQTTKLFTFIAKYRVPLPPINFIIHQCTALHAARVDSLASSDTWR